MQFEKCSDHYRINEGTGADYLIAQENVRKRIIRCEKNYFFYLGGFQGAKQIIKYSTTFVSFCNNERGRRLQMTIIVSMLDIRLNNVLFTYKLLAT